MTPLPFPHDPGTEPPLPAWPCRRLCSWGPTGGRRGGLPLFECAGCGSQWVRTEPWTPADASGEVPDVVRREAALRAGPPTSGPGGAGAGTAGS